MKKERKDKSLILRITTAEALAINALSAKDNVYVSTVVRRILWKDRDFKKEYKQIKQLLKGE